MIFGLKILTSYRRVDRQCPCIEIVLTEIFIKHNISVGTRNIALARLLFGRHIQR